jgi:hypothetical protein
MHVELRYLSHISELLGNKPRAGAREARSARFTCHPSQLRLLTGSLPLSPFLTALADGFASLATLPNCANRTGLSIYLRCCNAALQLRMAGNERYESIDVARKGRTPDAMWLQ